MSTDDLTPDDWRTLRLFVLTVASTSFIVGLLAGLLLK